MMSRGKKIIMLLFAIFGAASLASASYIMSIPKHNIEATLLFILAFLLIGTGFTLRRVFLRKV
ncbi:hypothetical protein [Alicyclobacillus tolerans]|uniref:Uncharacterized protein n=1 Tax=Alicyclobacillus tolerans TaxID=90970 RepID=A0ABT9LY42_9BACL|nr:hypothetical protein [Alicyclobacillus tengchongensis]MDP9729180.1 hypothetical protein [Alicyclobacillus tengchongensis]